MVPKLQLPSQCLDSESGRCSGNIRGPNSPGSERGQPIDKRYGPTEAKTDQPRRAKKALEKAST